MKTSRLVLSVILLLYFSTSAFTQPEKQGNPQKFVKVNDSILKMGTMEININTKMITIPAQVNMTSGLIEVALCTPKGKVHESLFKSPTTSVELQTALLLLGFVPVNSSDNTSRKHSDLFKIKVSWKKNGQPFEKELESFVLNKQKQQTLKSSTWIFNGIKLIEGQPIADDYISCIVTYSELSAVLALNSKDAVDDELFFSNADALGLKIGDEVTISILPYKN